MYRPEGKPEITGDVPPTDVQVSVALSAANRVSLARTSKVILVLGSKVSSQNRPSHPAPTVPVSLT